MTSQEQIEQLSKEIYEKKQALSKLRRQLPPEAVQDYELTNWQGQKVKLSGLFGDKPDLIVIHNMGKNCSYCTLWADGFVSVLPHILNRTAFVIVSPDAPEVQKSFAESRKWPFRMLSSQGSHFTKDMGFAHGEHQMPGVSAFYRNQEGQLFRTHKDFFGPGDDYSAPWHLFDLLEGGSQRWQPKFSY